MCVKISQILDLPFHTDAPKNIEYVNPVAFNSPASYWDSDDDRRDKFDCHYCLSLVCLQMGFFAIRKGFRIHQRLLSLQAQFALTSWKMFPAIKHKHPQRTKNTNEIILHLTRVYALCFFFFPKHCFHSGLQEKNTTVKLFYLRRCCFLLLCQSRCQFSFLCLHLFLSPLALIS